MSDIFEAEAADYEAWYATLKGQHAQALEKALLLKLIQETWGAPHSILEVGCGTGHFTRWFAELGLAAVGLDRSPAMLRQARALDSVPLLQGDAARLPFADGAFDLVTYITTLEFIEDPSGALCEGLRVSRRGLLLGVLNRWSLLGLERRLGRLLRPSVYDAGHFYGIRELRRLVQQVAGAQSRLAWGTTLFPRGWPWPHPSQPCGGFLVMALLKPQQQEAGAADHQDDAR